MTKLSAVALLLLSFTCYSSAQAPAKNASDFPLDFLALCDAGRFADQYKKLDANMTKAFSLDAWTAEMKRIARHTRRTLVREWSVSVIS